MYGDALHLVQQRIGERPTPEGAARTAPDDDLGDVLAAGEAEDGLDEVGGRFAPDLRAEPLGLAQGAVETIGGLGGERQAMGAGERQHDPAGVEAGGETARLAHDLLGHSIRPHADEQTLAGRPGAFDGALAQEVDHLVVDAVGCPPQAEFAKGREDGGAEEAFERAAGIVGEIDLARLEALDEFAGREIDQHHLVGGFEHDVRHRLAHRDPGNAGHEVGEAFEMLDVERGPDIDAGVQELGDILVALGMACAGGVGMGEFVDDQEAGSARQGRVEVELAIGAVSREAGQGLEPFRQRSGFAAPMGFDEADDHVGAPGRQGPGAFEHGEGLADTGRHAEEYGEAAPAFAGSKLQQRRGVGPSLVVWAAHSTSPAVSGRRGQD